MRVYRFFRSILITAAFFLTMRQSIIDNGPSYENRQKICFIELNEYRKLMNQMSRYGSPRGSPAQSLGSSTNATTTSSAATTPTTGGYTSRLVENQIDTQIIVK